jgi:hypothetical protein
MTLDEIVDDYIENCQPDARAALDEFQGLPSLKDAIRHASLCHRLPDLKRHPHQYRIPQSVLQAVERRLQKAFDQLACAADFEALHDNIYREIEAVPGIGALTIYDIAHRIGAFLGKAPKLVYLHRGTRVGARRLGFAGKVLDPRSLPSAFLRLTPAEIEDCLCIYKTRLLSGRSHDRSSRQRRGCADMSMRRLRKC